MNLRPEGIREDPTLGDDWIAARVDLIGPITAEEVNRAQRMIEDAINEQGVNFICLWLETEGGAPFESARASFGDRRPSKGGSVRSPKGSDWRRARSA